MATSGTIPGTQDQAEFRERRQPVRLSINGQSYECELDSRVTLLDALREYLNLPGSKKGCDQGQCGACTVHVNGQRVLACLSLAVAHQKDEITTIEGLAEHDDLHPMQEAFIACDAFQCGYCTPGQIMSAVALTEELQQPVPSWVTPDVCQPPAADGISNEELRERMSGNICRCGAYPNIVLAIRQAMTHSRAQPKARQTGSAQPSAGESA